MRRSTGRATKRKATYEEEEEEEEEEGGDEGEEEEDAEGGGRNFEGERGENDEILHCSFPGCLKEFGSRWSLTRHIRTHTGERPFKCADCGKEFVQKCSLKRHEQTHSDNKQWTCHHPDCGKKFKLKEYLDVHRRTHMKLDGSKPMDAGPVAASGVMKPYATSGSAFPAAAAAASSSAFAPSVTNSFISGSGGSSAAAAAAAAAAATSSTKSSGASASAASAVAVPNQISSESSGAGAVAATGAGAGAGAGAAGEDLANVYDVDLDTNGLLFDQLRQRLVRMSVRHREQVFACHTKERETQLKLEECTSALLECVTLLNVIAPQSVPKHIQEAAHKFASQIEDEPAPLKIGRRV